MARLLIEMNGGSIVVMSETGCRWDKGVGNARAGKPRRATVLSGIRMEWIEAAPDRPPFMWAITPAGAEAIKGIGADDVAVRPKLGMTVDFIIKALKKRHPFPQWVLAEEVRLDEEGRIVDLLAMSKKRVVVYEIKVTRPDFLGELEDPTKRAPAEGWFSQFYFAVPTGLVKAEEIPTGCGLIEIFHNKNFLETKAAETRFLHEPTWPLVVQIGRSITKAKR